MKLIPSVLSELATVTGFKLSCHYTNKRTVKTEITCHALGTPALCSGDFELVWLPVTWFSSFLQPFLLLYIKKVSCQRIPGHDRSCQSVRLSVSSPHALKSLWLKAWSCSFCTSLTRETVVFVHVGLMKTCTLHQVLIDIYVYSDFLLRNDVFLICTALVSTFFQWRECIVHKRS